MIRTVGSCVRRIPVEITYEEHVVFRSVSVPGHTDKRLLTLPLQLFLGPTLSPQIT